MRSLSIRARLLGLLIGLATVAILVAAVSFREADTTLSSVQSLAARRDALQVAAARLSDALHEQEANFLEFELTGDSLFLAQYRASIEVERSLDAPNTIAGQATPELARVFEGLRTAAETWRANAVEPEIDRILRGGARNSDAINRGEEEFDRARTALDQLHDALELDDAAARGHIAELTRSGPGSWWEGSVCCWSQPSSGRSSWRVGYPIRCSGLSPAHGESRQVMTRYSSIRK